MTTFCVGDNEFYAKVDSSIKRDYYMCDYRINDVMRVRQRVCWITEKTEQCIRANQEGSIA